MNSVCLNRCLLITVIIYSLKVHTNQVCNLSKNSVTYHSHTVGKFRKKLVINNLIIIII